MTRSFGVSVPATTFQIFENTGDCACAAIAIKAVIADTIETRVAERRPLRRIPNRGVIAGFIADFFAVLGLI
jgi:hypothetical protein